MKRNNIPLILMLLAGAITCIFTLIRDYPIWQKLLSLLIVLLVFYFLGSLLVWALDTFEIQNARKSKEEGEVIEKSGEDAEGQEGQEEAGGE